MGITSELKPKFNKNITSITPRASQITSYKAQHVVNYASSLLNHASVDFTANPLSLINKFAAYLQSKWHGEVVPTPKVDSDNHIALLGQFARFLANHDHVHPDKASGIFNAFSIALQTSIELDCWIIDSGATNHMTNTISNLHDFHPF